MTQKRQTQDMQSIKDAACEYAQIAYQIKELEKALRPLKQTLTDYAESVGLRGNMDLDAVTLEQRDRMKCRFDREKITPDWLYRFQSAGFSDCIDAKFLFHHEPEGTLKALMDEIGYREEMEPVYAVRVK